jgi:cytidylate kinase
MVGLQKELGASGGVVMEGRDIGTVVFPHADVKIFLDAAPEVRGQRRYDQLGQQDRPPATPPEAGAASGGSSSSGWDEVVRDLRARDERDRNRADSPLKPAADAAFLDSTNMTLEQALAAAEAIVAARVGQPEQTP